MSLTPVAWTGEEANKYLDAEFPKLDKLLKITVRPK